MSVDASDVAWMRVALNEAQAALQDGNLPIGAVIVSSGREIARGRNRVDSGCTDLAHAELDAITQSQHWLFEHGRECDIYTTLEPCLMCFGAIVHFHFRRLIIGAPDARVGALAVLSHSPYYSQRAPEIIAGCLADECRELIEQYVRQTGIRGHLLNPSG